MIHLPLFHNLQDENCVVVGGGAISARKIRLLHDAGALPLVFAEDIDPDIESALAARGGEFIFTTLDEVELLENEALHEAISSARLVIAATENPDINAMVSALARMHNVPVNVVDDPDFSTCIFPSTLSRGPMTIAVSSGGNAPVITRLLRARLESLLPHTLSTLASLASEARDPVRALLSDTQERRSFWDSILQDHLIGFRSDNLPETADALVELARNWKHSTHTASHHHIELISGDTDDLRFRELRWLQAADYILHEVSVPPAILKLARRDADQCVCNAATLTVQALALLEQGLHVVSISVRPVETNG
jgi:uroporphyrin-III C-methyltransferase/precorrin-2 dehydrogenase/sirohydrochlorin ferrochelatase